MGTVSAVVPGCLPGKITSRLVRSYLLRVAASSNTKFNQMLRDPTSYRLTRFAGTRVRMTDVAVELQNHQPVRVVRITFSFLTFDDGGYFDVAAFTRHQWARAELGFDLATAAPGSTGTVVDAETRFVAQGGLWKPSRKLQRQIDAAALGQVKCPRL